MSTYLHVSISQIGMHTQMRKMLEPERKVLYKKRTRRHELLRAFVKQCISTPHQVRKDLCRNQINRNQESCTVDTGHQISAQSRLGPCFLASRDGRRRSSAIIYINPLRCRCDQPYRPGQSNPGGFPGRIDRFYRSLITLSSGLTPTFCHIL